ncbi:MAG: hypothetical protein ACK4HF_02495 [Paracoccaceae bacterium]
MAASVAMRDYLRRRAAWVWNEQSHAFDHGLSLQEETLTEMLLLRMARDHETNGLTVKMFSKPEEAINGADWEGSSERRHVTSACAFRPSGCITKAPERIMAA